MHIEAAMVRTRSQRHTTKSTGDENYDINGECGCTGCADSQYVKMQMVPRVLTGPDQLSLICTVISEEIIRKNVE